MISGTRLHELETKALTSGGNASINLATLPRGERVRGFLLRIALAVTQPAAGMNAFAGDTLGRVLDAITIGSSRHRGTGMLLDRLGHVMHGRDLNAPADIPATASTTFNRTVDVLVSLADPTAFNPTDTAPACEMFRDETINLNAGNFASLFPGATAVTMSVRTLALLDPHDGSTLATPTRTNFLDVASNTVLLPAGTYSHIIVYREDGTAITDAQVSAVRVAVDGRTVMDRLTLGDFTSLYNIQRAAGGAKAVASATAPEAAEALDTGSSVAFLPLYVPPTRYKLTKLLQAESQVEVQFTGSITGLRIAYRQVEEMDERAVEKAARKLGLPGVSELRTATLSKVQAAPGRVAKLVPKKVG